MHTKSFVTIKISLKNKVYAKVQVLLNLQFSHQRLKHLDNYMDTKTTNCITSGVEGVGVFVTITSICSGAPLI